VLVCMGRAIAHGATTISRFAVPTPFALLAKYGFGVVQDEDLPMIGRKLSTDIAQATRILKHLRITTADRLPDQSAAAVNQRVRLI